MGEVILTKTQAALETVKGTPVAATRKVYGTCQLNRQQDLKLREEHGQFSQVVGTGGTYLGLIEATGSAEDDSLSYEDAPWWCQLGVKGGVAGVLQGTLGYLYTFVPSESTDDLKTGTFEGSDETQGWQMPYGMVDQLTLSGALGEAWKLRASLLGADLTPATLTPAIPNRTTEPIEMQATKLYIGAGGAVPVTQITGMFIDFELTINNNIRRKYFAGEGSAMKSHGRLLREVTCQFTFEETADAISERANWVGKTERTIKVEATGTQIEVGQNKKATLILPGLWETWQIGARESNRIFTMRMRAVYDLTLTYQFSLAFENALATLP